MGEYAKWKEYYSSWGIMELLREYREANDSIPYIRSEPVCEEPGPWRGTHVIQNARIAALRDILKERRTR